MKPTWKLLIGVGIFTLSLFIRTTYADFAVSEAPAMLTQENWDQTRADFGFEENLSLESLQIPEDPVIAQMAIDELLEGEDPLLEEAIRSVFNE